jgi:hypothetical protein
MDTSQHTDDIENFNSVRRSTRERRKSAWFNSCELDMCKSVIYSPGRKMASRHSAIRTEYWKWTVCLILLGQILPVNFEMWEAETHLRWIIEVEPIIDLDDKVTR